MSDKYILHVKNNSTQIGSFCIFQELPDINVSGITTLAWLAKSAQPSTLLEFEWGQDYSFIWARSTQLKPGTVVRTGQTWSANLKTQNKVNFDYLNGAYTFSEQSQGDHLNNLFIEQSHRIKPQDAYIGIGMSGKSTFLVPAEPNINVILTPRPSYWLLFGDYKEGEVLNVTRVLDRALKLDYNGINFLNIELTDDNNWNILSN